jgi:hypothetical protein
LRLRCTPLRLSQPKRKANRKDLVRGAGGAEAGVQKAAAKDNGSRTLTPRLMLTPTQTSTRTRRSTTSGRKAERKALARSPGPPKRRAKTAGRTAKVHAGEAGAAAGAAGRARGRSNPLARTLGATLRPARFSTKRLGPPARAMSDKMAPGGRSVQTRLPRKRFNNPIMRLNACSQASPRPTRNRQPAASLASKAQPKPSRHAAEDGGSARLSVLAGHCRGLMSAS